MARNIGGRETSLSSLSAGRNIDTSAHAKQVISRYIGGCPASIPGMTPMNEKIERKRKDMGQPISIAHATRLSCASCSGAMLIGTPPRSR